MQKQDICDTLIYASFAKLAIDKTFVGEIFTHLGLDSSSKEGLDTVAKELLEFIKKKLNVN